MKILAISGSPGKRGNTDTILGVAIDVLENKGIETEFIRNQCPSGPCQFCGT